MTRHIIAITNEHIRKGKKGKATTCPLALGLSEHFKQNIFVGNQGFWTSSLRFNDYISLPKNAEQFRKDFDAGCPVLPFSFEIWI